jgi:hypothetical protein
MATKAALKNRIVTEVNRDDLLDDLATQFETFFQRSIDYYADQRFSFNEARDTTVLVPGVEYVDLPTGTRLVDRVFVLINSTRYEMQKRETWYIEGLYSAPQQGQPTDFAFINGQIRLWPTPNQAWSLIWETVTDVLPPLTADTDSNAWTTQGQDLIDARCRMFLYRDQFRDNEGLAQAALAEKEALSRLKGESNRLISTGRVRASW